MRELTWTDDWEAIRAELRGLPFLAIDPGEHGAGVLWAKPFGFDEMFLLKKWSPSKIARAMQKHGAKVLVMENQYVGRSVKTALTIGYRKGLLLGALGAYIPDLAVVHVYPTQWQNEVLAGVSAITGGEKPTRKDWELASGNVAQTLLHREGIELPPMSKADLTGIHDAICIAQWFEWNTQEQG